MFGDIIAAGLIGAVGGGVGAGLGSLVERLLAAAKPEKIRKQKLGALVGAVLGMAVLTASPLPDQLANLLDPQSATELDYYGRVGFDRTAGQQRHLYRMLVRGQDRNGTRWSCLRAHTTWRRSERCTRIPEAWIQVCPAA